MAVAPAVNPHIAPPTPAPVENEVSQNIIQKAAEWYRSPETPLMLKIATVALAALAAFALGCTIAQTLLGLAVGSFVTVLCTQPAPIDVRGQIHAIQEEMAFEKIKTTLFNNWLWIPTVDVGNRENLQNGSIDFIREDDFPADPAIPIFDQAHIKGVDKYGRAFVALKLTRVLNPQVEEPAEPGPKQILVLYQRHPKGGAWHSTLTGGNEPFLQNPLNDEGCLRILKIMRGGDDVYQLDQQEPAWAPLPPEVGAED